MSNNWDNDWDNDWDNNWDNDSHNVDYTKIHNYYNTLLPLWETIFPTSPFNISLPKYFIKYLDEPFTNEGIIIIEDSRKSNSYTVIKSVYNKPITLRRIINRMIVNKDCNDGLNYLDDLKMINNNYYIAVYGSEELY